ncbi:cephalosporin hydroxylase [Paraburkholderia sp. HC6.4b]|uniref:CmcI family methyltransferase n=1 Tax=unclassified Paraburkholderia TaxID=2615204 RepID=UPI0018467545|nr:MULTISPECIES: CmcI family methyltransferase [unclassified Paraburkholderia]MBB5408219.1 cephalosporin hydroxylase [Paraburkholderia sp. HC6.4b]MBB5453210.1 cephalosporin hydroxylase [Paraburkholderia sp. Kb1A]
MFKRIQKFMDATQSMKHGAHAAAPWTSTHPGTFRASFAEPNLTNEERQLVESFSDLYYRKIDNFRGLHTIVLSWMGYEMFKCPLDLWVYQELIVRERPDLIIEVGTYKGGSALYLATVCDLAGFGEVITIDIDSTHHPIRPRHPRITYLTGDSIADNAIDKVAKAADGKRNILIILDGDHRCEHVLQELRLYQRFIQPGGFLVVEDTNINGHPTYPEFGPGPWEAVDLFLAENDQFYADRSCERFLLTMNPRGFLRRR